MLEVYADVFEGLQYAAPMRFRHILIAAAFLLPGLRAAAVLPAGDAAALRAVLDDRFPGRHGVIVVGDTTRGSITRGELGVPIGNAELGPRVTLIANAHGTQSMLRGTPAAVAAILFDTPTADAEKGTVLVGYSLALPEHDSIRSGMGRYTLRPAAKGAWAVVDKTESLVSFDPLKDPDALMVGGDVRAPVRIEGADPVSTPEATQAGVKGIVILELTIDTEGRVIGADVLKPLPFGLDRAAVDAVMQWRFRPGTLNGQPVTVIFNITVLFGPKKPTGVNE